MSLYEYVGSNPAALTDPMGLCGGTAPGSGSGGTMKLPGWKDMTLSLPSQGGGTPADPTLTIDPNMQGGYSSGPVAPSDWGMPTVSYGPLGGGNSYSGAGEAVAAPPQPQPADPSLGDRVRYAANHPMTTMGLALKALGGLFSGNTDALAHAQDDFAFGASTNYTTANEYALAGKSVVQGAVNTANGVQDQVIGLNRKSVV
jgi:hypothetical protein